MNGESYRFRAPGEYRAAVLFTSGVEQIKQIRVGAVREFLAHYHQERNHQGLDNHILEPGEEVGRREGRLACRQRLGGLLRYYYRRAA